MEAVVVAVSAVRSGPEPYPSGMAAEGWPRLHAAYAQAWSHRGELDEVSMQPLLDSLRAAELDEWTAPGPGLELVTSCWVDGVQPRHLERALRTASPRFIGAAVAQLVPPFLDLVRMLAAAEVDDLSWQDPPEGHRMLSDVRRSNDLALRWFFPRAEEVWLKFTAAPSAEDFLAKTLITYPGMDPTDTDELRAWVRTQSTPGDAEVFVGQTLVGAARLEPEVWDALRVQAGKQVFADGRLTRSTENPDTVVLKCWVPRMASKTDR